MAFNRRSLLRSSALVAAAASVGCEDKKPKDAPDAPAKPAKAPTKKPPARGLGEAELACLASVSGRILPSEGDGPGAKEANVAGFFEKAFQDPRLKGLMPTLKRACRHLDRAAQAEHKVARFSELDAAKQDDLLGRLANNKMRPNGFSGPQFMRAMVALTLEGFLGAPTHGGNQGQLAWTWLGYDPNKSRAEVFGGAK